MNRETLLKLKQSYRADNPVLYNLVSVIIGEVDRIDSKNPSEDLIISVMKKIHKNNLETIENLIDLDNGAYVQKLIELSAESEFLFNYLPKQLEEQDIVNIITEYQTNHSTNCSVGEIMKHFKTNHDGQYDGKVVSAIVKKIVNSQSPSKP